MRKRDVRDELLLGALERGQTVRLRATSGSMLPTIIPGDLVFARREAYEPGDILLITLNDVLVAHRLVDDGDEALLLCGDARSATAHTAARTHVLGRVIAHRPTLTGRARRVKLRLRTYWQKLIA